MPIAALPENTVHAIGSTQVLTDSHSVVKELIDNALDARASAIFIEISLNTLDTIQVKDNGYGIAPIDRPLVCKRHCTSKITNFDDIAEIGGRSLGFRGEALASAAEISGLVIMTTKVEGEPTAVSQKIGRRGDIESEERTSHAVGTTIRIVDFLKSIPVRRQTALKQTTKTISNIRKTIQAYALARPAIRYSLKVLKAKNDRANFTYAPKSEASVSDAATKIFGIKLVEQCQWRVWTTSGKGSINHEHGVDHVGGPEDIFTVEALLPAPGCDLGSISGIGQYMSVDSRPVSPVRGTLKQVIGLYKSYLRSSFSCNSGEKLLDPFLCLNIVCPPGSYDPNIEPSKNDVLFSDANLVLKHLELFFKDTYGQLQTTTSKLRAPKPPTPKEQEFDVFLARTDRSADASFSGGPSHSKVGDMNNVNDTDFPLPRAGFRITDVANRTEPIPTRNKQATSIADVAVDEIPSEKDQAELPSESSIWMPNMFVGDDEEIDLFVAQDYHGKDARLPDLEEQAALQDVRVSNPWTIAKMNAPIQSQAGKASTRQLLTPARQSYDREITSTISPASISEGLESQTHGLQSPRLSEDDSVRRDPSSSSPQRFPYPLAARGSRSGDYALRALKASNAERHGSGALDTWVQEPVNGYECNRNSSSDDHTTNDREVGTSRDLDIVSSRDLFRETPASAIPKVSSSYGRSSPKKQISSHINKPFKSPLNDPDRNWFDVGPKSAVQKPKYRHGPQSILNTQEALGHASCRPQNVSVPSREQPAMHPDLAISLDYESRKALAMQQRKFHLTRQASLEKERLPEASNSPRNESLIVNTPHKNRYRKAVAALHLHEKGLNNAKLPAQTSALEPGDPRQYLMHIQECERAAGAEAMVSPSRAPQSKRKKTAMLPLETIREEWVTRDLVLQVRDTKTLDMGRKVKQARNSDEYISSGIITAGLVAGKTMKTIRAWESQIKTLVSQNYQSETAGPGQGFQAQIQLELWPAMQEYLAGQELDFGEQRQLKAASDV